MGCIKPPLAVSPPTQRASGRLAFGATTAPTAQPQASVTSAVNLAKQQSNRAGNEIQNATTVKAVEQSLTNAKAAIEAALAKTDSPSEKQSLRDRLRNLEAKAADRQITIVTVEYVETLRSRGKIIGLSGANEAIQYQVSVLGSFVEYDVGLPGGPSVIADGINTSNGYLQDAKFASDEQSFYDPESMGSSKMVEIAKQDARRRLSAYKEVVESSSNPFRGLEIITTDQNAAEFFQDMMDDIGLAGRVRIE